MSLGAECLAVRISKHDMAIGNAIPALNDFVPTDREFFDRKPIHRQILKFSETETRISIDWCAN